MKTSRQAKRIRKQRAETIKNAAVIISMTIATPFIAALGAFLLMPVEGVQMYARAFGY